MTMTFGSWLYATRGTMSVRAFADKVSVDPRTVSGAERSESDVLVTTAVRLCRGLGLSLNDFYQNWQGECIEAAAQHDQEQWRGTLSVHDVQRWLLRLLEGHQRNRELLISALNLIALHSLQSSPSSDVVHVFKKTDFEKMVWDSPTLRYKVTPPLQHIPLIADLLSIYQRGGLVLPVEIGAYIRFVRLQKEMSLPDVQQATGIPIAMLKSIEHGMVKQVKLSDLILLDSILQRGGEILSLYWWQISCRQIIEEELAPLAYSTRTKHALSSLLISVGRWLQVIYQDDIDWHDAIQYELGLYTPCLPTRAWVLAA